jgi:hypothetical protein
MHHNGELRESHLQCSYVELGPSRVLTSLRNAATISFTNFDLPLSLSFVFLAMPARLISNGHSLNHNSRQLNKFDGLPRSGLDPPCFRRSFLFT